MLSLFKNKNIQLEIMNEKGCAKGAKPFIYLVYTVKLTLSFI